MKLRSLLCSLAMLVGIAVLPAAAQLQTVQLSPAGDPCFSSLPKLSVAVSISTATTTQLVALSAGKAVYVCAFAVQMGASTSAVLEFGTGSACATGTTALTGAYTVAASSAMFVNPGHGQTIVQTTAGKALCVLSTGTGGINGVLSYVQR